MFNFLIRNSKTPRPLKISQSSEKEHVQLSYFYTGNCPREISKLKTINSVLKKKKKQ